MKDIHLWGVKQNNLKNLEVRIPLGSFTVICGPSGSGKSSLAFETLYAEGQRAYIESLSNYARQFLNKAPKPDVEGVENIPPALAIEQKNAVKSGRSTVGTTTEVIDYLRLFFEKVGKAYCPEHKIPTAKESVSTGAKKTLELFKGKRGYILSPVFAERRVLVGKKLHSQLLKSGYLRIYLPPKSKKEVEELKFDGSVIETQVGQVIDLMEPILAKRGLPRDTFYLVIDRMSFDLESEGRLADSISQAYEATLRFNTQAPGGVAHILTTEGKLLQLSEENSCAICGYTPPSISSRLFSFNSPIGACPSCKGFGNILDLDENKVVPNPVLTIAEGALHPFTMPSAKQDFKKLKDFCEKNKIDVHIPWKDLPKPQRKMVWEGKDKFWGVKGLFEYLDQIKYKMHVRVFIARYRSPFVCRDCKGSRLRQETNHVLIDGYNITDLSEMTIGNLLKTVKKISLSENEKEIADEILRQIISRLRFLVDVGVEYLTLNRETRTLSGGEYQRLNLANQLGMGLSQSLYVLDEPTVGLHPRDNDKLIQILKQLKDLGNTLVIVEHDHDVIRNSEYLLELGPGSGYLGGRIIFEGKTEDFYSCSSSNTAQYIKPAKGLAALPQLRPVDITQFKYKIDLFGCSGHNLRNLDVSIPLNRLVTVTGVSGSGKSSLISQTLYPAVARTLGVEYIKELPYEKIEGINHLKNVIMIDQSPIGKTARSNPVTYLKIFDHIRQLFANTADARYRGYTAGTFSLNVDGGRCPVCKGLGYEEVDMVFMDNVLIPCDACDSKKFRSEVLEVLLNGKNINDVLKMTVQEAMDFFVSHPNIRNSLAILKEVGLEYICLGQSATTLSGGESQRLKIARELAATQQRGTLYILDEPTTGLHFREVNMLLKVLNKLIEAGGSVVLIEHNQDVIRASDYIIDMGPGAGNKGGKIVFAGSPEEVIRNHKGDTGKYLKKYLTEQLGINLAFKEKDGKTK